MEVPCPSELSIQCYAATAGAVAAPFFQLRRRWLRVLYILQQSTSYACLKKVVFPYFYQIPKLCKRIEQWFLIWVRSNPKGSVS